MRQYVLTDGQPHHHDWHEYSHAIIRHSRGGLTSYQEHDHDGDAEGYRNRAGERTAGVAVDDDLRDFTDGHIAPFGSLSILESGHRGSGKEEYCQELVSPIQQLPAWKLVEADEGQIADQSTAQCSVKHIEANGECCQKKSGQAAIE